MQRVVTYPRWVLRSSALFLLVVFGLNAVFPPPLDKAKNVSAVVFDTHGEWMAGFTVEDGIWRIPVKLNDVDPRFIERLIAIEDERFWEHNGVDVPAIFRAASSWRKAGKPVSGASTITMQLVRQIEPRPRTMGSKALESLRALQYEQYLSKTEILELYLTHISYGGNLDGIYAASLAYFGKPPKELNDAEIALLIAIPQAPEARRPDLWPNVAKRGRDKILRKLQGKNILTALEVKEASELPVTTRREDIAQTAWLSAKAVAEPGNRVRSTIDLNLQSEVQAIADQYLLDLPEEVNLAMTVVENNSMKVRAHIASAARERNGGWLDMTNRYRSPGSTLKPFIYGVAMEDGVLSQGSWITDEPTRFGSYQPDNFNHRFYGKVRIHEALRHSLNVPAVIALDKIGSHRFEKRLQSVGVNIERLGGQSEEAGLAIALGGAGTTLNDLALGYAALANEGNVRPLIWTEDQKGQNARRLFSEDVAQELTQILRQSPTPDGHVPAWLTYKSPSVAYKTGTSYGFRDAWAAGYTGEWTVVVWVGRPDGAPRKGQTGREAAAPIMFDVINALPSDEPHLDYIADMAAPIGLQEVDDYVETGPQILFPPDGVELLSKNFGKQARGFSLTARSEGDVSFFVDGSLVVAENGLSIWRPDSPGFYEILAVDDAGRVSKSNISVLALNNIPDPRF